MLLPWEAISEEPEGFHLKKENARSQNKKLVTSLPLTPVTQKALRIGSKGWHPFKVDE